MVVLCIKFEILEFIVVLRNKEPGITLEFSVLSEHFLCFQVSSELK